MGLGVIKVEKHILEAGFDQTRMRGLGGRTENYPNKALESMIEKEWIQREEIKHHSKDTFISVRIYIIPEDTGRRFRRGSLSEFRKAMKYLMTILDCSQEGWDATFDSYTHSRTYSSKLGINESLFYIFNTLESPVPRADLVRDHHSRHAMTTILNDQVAGLNRALYPYQRRSAAAMVQREAEPARNPDPRLQLFQAPTGQKFYYDHEDGRLLSTPDLYEDQRGGILAETMGFGKTLICLSVILATRGHLPQIPEGKLAVEQAPRDRTGSLFEMAAATAERSGRPWKAFFNRLTAQHFHHDGCIEALSRNVGTYYEPIFNPRSGNRQKQRPANRVIKLCSTTLVIIPPNLLGQWQGEIAKHTDQGALDVLTIDTSVKEIPHEDELRKYDVVLITKPRFEKEYRDNDFHTGMRSKGSEVFQSPLVELRWLRVVVDEGHNFASSGQKTNAMAMLDKMSIERRWVVSGTPSNALIGVEVGLAAEENEEVTDSPGQKSREVLQRRQIVESAEEERSNLEKLRLIVVNFLRLRPWARSIGEGNAAWNRYVVGTKSASNHETALCLRSILQNLFVRHRIQDIEVDLTLPPLYNKVVYLEPSFYDKLSINLFLAILASNAVTSERVDQDYMFHDRNRKQLEVLISNLRQSSFHWVGLKRDDISEAVRISKLYLENNKDNTSSADKRLLDQAIAVGEKALNSPAWNAFSALHEIGVFIKGFPDSASETWALDSQTRTPLLLGTVQARIAQSYIDDRLHEMEPADGLSGAGVKAMSHARRRAATEDATVTKSKKESGILEEPKLKDQTATVRVRSDSIAVKQQPVDIPQLDTNSPLATTEVVGFSSSKLSYLVSQLLKVSPGEKSIVFYSHNNVAFWLAEALELFGIRFLIYSNTLTIGRRATYLATFNQKDEFRVLLMDLKQAAHGLHVAAASRVFIVEPIWQPGIESQAIKRAHRIGQVKSVFVETLVLRGTLEDRMLRRRKQMSNVELQQSEKSLLDDKTMNEIIKSETMIPFTSDEERPEGQMAALDSPEKLFGRLRSSATEEDNPDDGLVLDPLDSAPRKRKRKAKAKSLTDQTRHASSGITTKRRKKVVEFALADTTDTPSSTVDVDWPSPVRSPSPVRDPFSHIAESSRHSQSSAEVEHLVATPSQWRGSRPIASIFGGPATPS